ncbi:hypothetical protein LIER_25383 [Lithospermum erythrorhizon]|uniref:Uncharacterized protein n=1 Tax=Lithospermum erythrorhizon TaxID=34254 RepID=A0AAV3RAE6_LITER
MHQLINMSESQPVPALNHSTLPSSSLLSHNPDPTKIDAFNQLTNGIANSSPFGWCALSNGKKFCYKACSFLLICLRALDNCLRQLEQMLQGELQGSWPYQQLFMSRQSRQPNRGEYGLAYQRELYQFQQQYIDEIPEE